MIEIVRDKVYSCLVQNLIPKYVFIACNEDKILMYTSHTNPQPIRNIGKIKIEQSDNNRNEYGIILYNENNDIISLIRCRYSEYDELEIIKN